MGRGNVSRPQYPFRVHGLPDDLPAEFRGDLIPHWSNGSEDRSGPLHLFLIDPESCPDGTLVLASYFSNKAGECPSIEPVQFESFRVGKRPQRDKDLWFTRFISRSTSSCTML